MQDPDTERVDRGTATTTTATRDLGKRSKGGVRGSVCANTNYVVSAWDHSANCDDC